MQGLGTARGFIRLLPTRVIQSGSVFANILGPFDDTIVQGDVSFCGPVVLHAIDQVLIPCNAAAAP